MRTSIDEISKFGFNQISSSETTNATTKLTQSTRPVRASCMNQPVRLGYKMPPSYSNSMRTDDIHKMNTDNSWLYNIKFLSLSGGGTKGYAHTGAILTLDRAFFEKKLNLYSQLEGVSGTSIGAMFALYIILGVRGQQLIKEVFSKNIVDSIKEANIQNLIDIYGLCSTTMFQNLVFNLLETHIGKGDVTFKELFDITNKHFVCNVTNINTGSPEYHSHLSTPHYKVYESVAASMCVPLMFAPCIINNQCYVDGALTDNCPFSVFPIKDTLIINLCSSQNSVADISSLKLYIMKIVSNVFNVYLENILFDKIPAEERKRVLKIQFRDLMPLDLTVDIETKKKLAKIGVHAMENFIQPMIVWNDVLKKCIKIIFMNILRKCIS
jgi:predicted acylesterase/phospholipase RssA